MKLRFHADSLRLRLSQSEVTQLAQTGSVEETVTFSPGHSLSYTLEKTGTVHSITVSFDADRIRVALPTATATHWIESDEIGIEAATPTLKVLVEKDFQCLHRVAGDEDAFPNPLAAS